MIEKPKTCLQQFARLPRPGRVKTRLQAALSAEEACAVHCELLELVAGDLLAADIGPVELWLDEVEEHAVIERCLAAGLRGPFRQRGENLGRRMENAVLSALEHSDRVILTGSDCPGLDPRYLRQAADALTCCDVVFGPADDGGYVLLGCRCMEPGLFDGVDWGTEHALAQSESRVLERGWSIGRLATRFDVDTPADLARWRSQAETGTEARL